ncbi:putative chromatin regulator PHD family [Helianthus debilis subsp. tardiflorus]
MSSSYGVIVPYSKLLIIVNQQLENYVDKVLVITPTTSETVLKIKIQEYEEGIHSTLLLDEWHVYTTICMMLTTNHKSGATVRLLGGSQPFGGKRDLETAMMISRYVMLYESVCANGFSGEKILDRLIEVHWNEEEKEKEKEICVICQKEFEAGEICYTLECGHWYHKECINEWLNHKSLCPICRDKVFTF